MKPEKTKRKCSRCGKVIKQTIKFIELTMLCAGCYKHARTFEYENI